MSTPSGTAAPPPMAQVRELIQKHSEQGWDEAWKVSVTPWDAGTYQPPLKDLIDSKILDIASGGKALVPGCGRGYDAICIADGLGLETLGTDISSTAVQAAQDYLNSTSPASPVRYEVADFFALAGSFDLVYDYTFFVAIPPSRRVEWGQQMSKLVKPGGYLVTVVFPIDPYTETGPPFYVRPEHYDEVLGDGWEKVLDKVPETSLESHINRERIVVRKKL
ncbi:thiol methyltransferase 1 [Lentinus tigrinus ALCF2SS1-7]|uniref:Thiol methyltransferase 1 n=1 Tax=Lentinus tigrinus ALCF2SS1-6 TaxID=1328759 RepID=A0A5C2RP77_9APHY|nr:thiol methyltransferase 1 [Lentinus tigrinus ALCF2SS1-6]RPD79457.1 thiol methyltransferase 1 [Lentinus tigrinus ALCF2SS1-7]